MTRELKLALIIAVTLVLSVMVLISDHLAVQRRPKQAEVAATQPIGTPPPPVAEPPVSAPKEPAVAEQPQGTVPPVRIAEGGQPVDAGKVMGAPDDHKELAKAVEAQGGSINKGVVTLAPFAGGSTEPIGSESDFNGVKSAFPTSPIDPVEIVQGKGGTAAKADTATAGTAAGGKTHIVAPGDTAYKLARIYLGDGKYWKKIVDANPKAFNGDGQIKVGAQLVIPTTGAPAPVKAAPASPDAKPSPTRIAYASDKTKAKVAKAYTIRKGDTLHSIAKRELGSSGRVDEIIRLNKGVIKDPTSLPLGVAIALPSDQR